MKVVKSEQEREKGCGNGKPNQTIRPNRHTLSSFATSGSGMGRSVPPQRNGLSIQEGVFIFPATSTLWEVHRLFDRSAEPQHDRDRLSAGEWLRSFRGVKESAYFAFDDLWPCVMRVWNLARSVFESTLRLPAKKNAPDSENLSQPSKLRKEV